MDDDAMRTLATDLANRSGMGPHPRGHFTVWQSRVPEDHLLAFEEWANRSGGVFVHEEANIVDPPQLAAGTATPAAVTPAHWIIPLAAIGES